MKSPERLARLPKYTFDRLRNLLGDHAPGREVLDLSIGAPPHAYPKWIFENLPDHHLEFGRYPRNHGNERLLGSIAAWIERRYGINLDPDLNVIACNGSREGLFSACMAVCPEHKNGTRSLVLMPNPFYQVYAGAALSAAADPYFVPATKVTGYLPDFVQLDRSVLDRAAVAFICSPSNPQGVVASRQYLEMTLQLARQHDFTIIADECYSEVYRYDPPTGMLEVAGTDRQSLDRVVVLNSLSKRSNLPGIRSGFIASGERTIAQIKHFRSYNEPVPTVPLQEASALAWGDEVHVEESRAMYIRKYALADEILGGLQGYRSPEAGMYLWLNVGDGEKAATHLWTAHGVRTVPGKYFTQGSTGSDAGASYIRVALVVNEAELREGLGRIGEYMQCLQGD